MKTNKNGLQLRLIQPTFIAAAIDSANEAITS